jgi:TRAP-type C4-dicarboxylate transport system permease small subunit
MENKVGVPVSRFDAAVMWISKILAAVSAVSLVVMMVVSVWDVAGRYFFLRPLEGASEIVGLSLIVASILGVAYCELLKGQIRVTILTDLLKRKPKEIFNIIAYLISIMAVGLIVQGSLEKLRETFVDVRAISDTASIPYWPFALLMFIGFAWMVIILVIELVKSVREVIKR